MGKYSEYFTYLKAKYIKIGSTEINEISTDGAMAGNSDSCVPTEKAVKTYVDNKAGAIDAMTYKGVIACVGEPNYPAGSAGDFYVVSSAGKIGGSSGVAVEVGDALLCNTDGTTSGNHASKGTYWNIIQTNLTDPTTYLYTAETTVTDHAIPRYDNTGGKLIQKSVVTIDDNGTINIPSGQTYKINTVALAYGDVGAAAAGHNHSGVYLAIAGTAANSALLETHNSAYFAVAGHNHSGTYVPVSTGSATGDIMYYNGSAWARLAKGSSGQILAASSSGLPYWKTA